MTILLRLLVLVAAAVQIVFPVYVNPFREGGHRGFKLVESSQIEPAGYAFAIWGPIYLLALAYAVWQLTPRGRADPVTAAIAPYAIVLYAGSSVWLAAAQYGPFWATIPILLVMAVCACVSLIAAVSMPGGVAPWRTWAVVVPFGLYAGWTVCASAVNIAEIAPAYGFARFGLSIPAYAVVSIAAVTVVAGLMLLRTGGSLPFAGTVIWALVAIIVAAVSRGHAQVVPITAGLAIVVVLGATAYLKTRGSNRMVAA
jgi:hypothetical protein